MPRNSMSIYSLLSTYSEIGDFMEYRAIKQTLYQNVLIPFIYSFKNCFKIQLKDTNHFAVLRE